MSHKQVNDILGTLHLTEAVRTRCASLSGGERKRLSIALEMIDNRSVLYCDEPTSGLDSSAAAYTIRMLQQLSHKGRTVVCTIHQPSAALYEMFDSIFVLSAGRCIYRGSAPRTVPFLAELGLNCPRYHNPADFRKSLIRKNYN